MANKKAVGRPPKFKTKEEIQEKIDRYFESCEGEILKNSKGEVVLDRFGKPVYIDQKPPTVTGLALALGFSGRQSLLNYQSKAEFVDTIMRAKSRVEEYTEQRLFDRDGSDGAKFSLRNNFRGWDDKPQSEMDQEEQRIRIEHMKAQVEQTRAQTEKIKAQTGEEEEIADDGFLEALKGAAAEDWTESYEESQSDL